MSASVAARPGLNLPIRELAHKYASVKDKIARFQAKNEQAIKVGFQLTAAGVVGGGLGFVNGKYGGSSGEALIPGIKAPVDATVAAGAFVLAAFGGLGKYAEHGHNVAAAALAVYAARVGVTMAQKSEQTAGLQEITGWSQGHYLPMGAQQYVISPNGAYAVAR